MAGSMTLVVWVGLTVSGGAARETKPLPPAVEVSDDVLFYAPMDGFVHAAAAKGKRRAVKVSGPVTFVKGHRGQAALLGDTPTRRYWLEYPTKDHLDMKEGTIAFWLQPNGWSGTDDGFRFFFMIADPKVCNFYIYRYTKLNLVALAGTGQGRYCTQVLMPTRKWTDGQWVHVAVTWKDSAITLYVDGKRVGSKTMPEDKRWRALPPVFKLGQCTHWGPKAKTAHTAMDEFVIFSRALDAQAVVKERDRQGLP